MPAALSSDEGARWSEIERLPSAAERLAARYRLFDEIVAARLAATGRAAELSRARRDGPSAAADVLFEPYADLARLMLDETVPEEDLAEIRAAIVAGAERYEPTEADREAEEAARRVRELEAAVEAGEDAP